MPDPSPTGWRAQDATTGAHRARSGEDDFRSEIEPGDEAASARDVVGAHFVHQCLRLADWMGSGRSVTQAGLLRPAVAREAYASLELEAWARTYEDLVLRDLTPAGPALGRAADHLRSAAGRQGWRSAGERLPLDRLWFPVVEAALVEVGSTRATRASTEPASDEEWRYLGLGLVAALCHRLGTYVVEPLAGVLSIPALAGGPVALSDIRAWWQDLRPEALAGEHDRWQHRLDRAIFHVEDCGMFRIEDDRVGVTDFGRDCAKAVMPTVEDGSLDHD